MLKWPKYNPEWPCKKIIPCHPEQGKAINGNFNFQRENLHRKHWIEEITSSVFIFPIVNPLNKKLFCKKKKKKKKLTIKPQVNSIKEQVAKKATSTWESPHLMWYPIV